LLDVQVTHTPAIPAYTKSSPVRCPLDPLAADAAWRVCVNSATAGVVWPVARARDPGIAPVSAYDVQAVTLGEWTQLLRCAFAATS
jgi:hypothetical protein